MYKVDTTIDSEARGLNFIDIGIHENAELTNVEYKVSQEGNEFMVFTFSKDDKILTHTEWKPRDEDPEKLENKTKNQVKRVKHIVTKYIPEEKYVFNAETFKSFCENTINLLGDTYKGKKVRLKVVYSYNNYTSLPNYVPFIESMDIPFDKSRLEMSSIDKVTKDKPDTEVVTRNPIEDLEETETVFTIPDQPEDAVLDELGF